MAWRCCKTRSWPFVFVAVVDVDLFGLGAPLCAVDLGRGMWLWMRCAAGSGASEVVVGVVDVTCARLTEMALLGADAVVCGAGVAAVRCGFCF